MSAGIKASAGGTQTIIQVNGVDKVVVGSTGIEAGSYKAGSITPTELSLAASSIGVGQTWQNVTGSRVSGTTYTNSTGKPIAVMISGGTNSSSQGVSNFTIGGTSIFAGNTSTQGVGSTFYSGSGPFIVPDGATYSATFSFASATNWSELR